MGAAYAMIAGVVVYATVDILFGFRLAAEDERRGTDLSIHKIGANPEEDVRLGRV
jgi:Amt family ammonium transporter